MTKEKYIKQSKTEQIQIVMSRHINGNSRLFGGALMQWVDVVAATVARRHSETDVTTAFIDSLSFKAPAFLNNIVLLKGKLTFVGTTSMEVRVDSYAEYPGGTKTLVNTAYLVMVAVDENDIPVAVPKLILSTDEEIQEYKRAEKRYSLRKTRNKENY